MGAREQSQQSASEVFQVVCVQKRVDRRIEMRKNDAEVNHRFVDEALLAESVDAVDGVERDPADHKKRDDNGEILRGLDFSFLCGRVQQAKHLCFARLLCCNGADCAVSARWCHPDRR